MKCTVIHKVMSLLLGSMLACSRALAADVAPNVRVTVHADSPGPAIPNDFLGLSYEKNVLATGHFCATNAAIVQLLRNLGGGVLRFGGNYVEYTTWSRTEPKSFSKARSVIGPSEVDQLYALATQSGWQVIHGLNLGANDPAMAADEAAYAMQAGGAMLLAFEIGNEPEHFGDGGLRSTNYVYAAFRDEVASYVRAIRTRTKRVPLAGPATTSNFPWFTGFLADFKSDVVLSTRHHYPLAAATNEPTHPRFATVENLLSAKTQQDSMKLMAQHQKASQAAGVPFRVGEAGSASSGGKAGVSEVFAAALWSADYLFDLAERGVSGINFHGSFNCRGYTTFCFRDNHYHAHPTYYGMLLFHQAARGRVVPVDCATAINLTAHAVLGDDGKLRVALINKDLKQAATVSIQAGQAFAKAGIWQLSAPAVTARDGITFAGSAVAPDGTWTPQPLAPVTFADGKCDVTVPSASAALITFESGKK